MKLCVRHLEYKIGSDQLLHVEGLDLHLSGITLLTGANGSGKSLLLAALHGVLNGATGNVTWDEEEAYHSRKSRGMLFQRNPILRRSVFENLAFPLRSANSFDPKRVYKMLERLDLADRAASPAAQLSGGERQRLCLGRAMIAEPKVLLLDEPTSALDRKTTQTITDLITDVSKTTPVIMSSHDRDVIDGVSAMRLQIEDGHLI